MAIQNNKCIVLSKMIHSILMSLISSLLISSILTSCKDWSDVKLTGRTKRIIELYIEKTDSTNAPIFIYGYSNQDEYVFEIYADEQPYPGVHNMYGNYYGTTFFKKRKIEVWGDDCNGFFWEPRHKPVYVSKPKEMWEFDPDSWTLSISKSDSTIIENDSELLGIDDISFPMDTFNTLLKPTR